MLTEAPVRQENREIDSNEGTNRWWRYCLFLLALKTGLLVLDPLPKFFIGDSACYIATAIVGWIPDDRSYFYGFVIRLVALYAGSLTPLLLLQSFVSAMTALLLAYTCRVVIGLSVRSSYLIGIACALDPFQLVWERYVMTETISLFFYVAGLYYCFLYLKQRRLRHLVFVQALWLILIGFRMSFLLVVQVSTILLPILAFLPILVETWRNRKSAGADRFQGMKRALGHFVTSIAVMLLFHGTYKQVNGLLCGRPPAYLYATGLHLLAFWAPMLVPADASDPRLAQIIAQGDEFDIKELTARNSQRFDADHLVTRWQEVEPDVTRANQIARETAMHALWRSPREVAELAIRTFTLYWDFKELKHYAKIDLGHNDLTDDQIATLAEYFHFATDGRIIDAAPSPLQRYFLGAWFYCYFLLLSPVLGIITLYLTREKQIAFLVLVHLTIIVGVTITFTVAPSLRYLQPASVLLLFVIAFCLEGSKKPHTNALLSTGSNLSYHEAV